MTKDAQEPPASKNAGQQEVSAAARVPLPPELQERITANTEELARSAWKAAGGKALPAQEIVDQIVSKNPDIFGKAGASLLDVIRASGLGTTTRSSSISRAAEQIRQRPESQLEVVKLPPRPEVDLLRRLIEQVKATDQHQAAILAIQQAEYERSQKRDAEDAARDQRDHTMQKWNLAVSSIAAVAGIIAIVVTILVAT
ncbi:hypothetical protein [Phycicoccus sp. 3266]|uniref:hypothetical protein n=1 Tax=Phycicoccus sp. 3266 TaxID=2817751 RepID=UPI0028641F3E|nr:hypothetical protein [Phycicoccus sp. 3266]MDR6861959.1 hypothetical protein [Phycicoccus sp. 3266]